MRIIVTGSHGFIGSHLCRKLREKGHEVITIDNQSRKSGIEQPEPDWSGFPLRGFSADVLVHLAGSQGTNNFYRYPNEVMRNNITLLWGLEDFLKRCKVKRLVFASTSEVYGPRPPLPTPEEVPLVVADPKNPRWSYALSKIIGEQMCWASFARLVEEVVVLRYFNVYGPGAGEDHVIPQLMRKAALAHSGGTSSIEVVGGDQTRSFCYIDDAVQGTILAIEKKEAAGEAFNIGMSRETIIMNLALMIAAKWGITKATGKPLELEGDARRRRPDISKAKNLLGYEPMWGLVAGLEKTMEAYILEGK